MASTDLRARVKVNGREHYLGKFTTPQLARAVEALWRLNRGIEPWDRSEAARKGNITRTMRRG